MKIFQKVTLKYLKKNKVRTIATVAGILLSTAMICAVLTFLSSMDRYVVDNAVHNTGDWHAGILNVDWETCEPLTQDEEVTDLVLAQRLGYAKIMQCEYEYKAYYYLLGVKPEFLDTMCAHITSGRFPREQYEILLPESLYEISGVKFEIGDKLVLETGKRMYRSTVLWQDDPYTFFSTDTDRESFSREKSRLYTVVGFYDDLSYKIESASAPGYTVFAYFEEDPLWKTNYDYDAYFKVENENVIYDFAANNGFTQENDITVTFNAEVLGITGILQQGSSQKIAVLLVAFILCLIIVGAIALIYNMFSISVSERTKQFGLLSSIGATQKQIQKMVWFESLVVSVVGIPFGIVAGIGGVWLALYFIGDKFEALGYSIPMTMHISWEFIGIAAVTSLITVLISAWIPSRRAMKSTIIETLRQNRDIYQVGKKEKTYGLANKVFGLSGILASQYCNRSKKKYKTTVLSLFVSGILFVLVSFFMDYILKTVEQTFDENSYDLAFYFDEEKLEEGYSKDTLFELLKSEEHITDAVYTTSTKTYRAEMDKKYLSSWALENVGTMTRSYRLNPDVVTLSVNITFVQDEAFTELIQKYDLKEEDYFNTENPKAIVIDNALNSNTNTTVNLLAGDSCIVSFCRAIYITKLTANGIPYTELDEKLYYDLEGGKTIYERPYYIEEADGLIFLYPESLRQYYVENSSNIYPDVETGWYFDEELWDMVYVLDEKQNDYSRLIEDHMCNCKFVSDDYGASYESMKKIVSEYNAQRWEDAKKSVAEEAEKYNLSQEDQEALLSMLVETNMLSENNFMNNAGQIAKENSLIAIIQVLSLGFIVLISLVAAINVFNTISTNISLRRREFAVLESIGMTQKALNRMVSVECLLMSGKALLYGFPVSLVGTYLIHLAVSEEYSISYRFPWLPMCVAIAGIFVIVFLTMLNIMRVRRTDNVLDALKNENI